MFIYKDKIYIVKGKHYFGDISCTESEADIRLYW